VRRQESKVRARICVNPGCPGCALPVRASERCIYCNACHVIWLQDNIKNLSRFNIQATVQIPMASSRIQTDHTQPPANSSYDPLKPSTFVAPTLGTPYSVIIEFCDRVSIPATRSVDSYQNVFSVAGES
jgi:hypothetical protein